MARGRLHRGCGGRGGRAETSEEVQDALVRIPVAYRSVVVLHDAHGWTSREIADVMDLSLPATKQRLRRGG